MKRDTLLGTINTERKHINTRLEVMKNDSYTEMFIWQSETIIKSHHKLGYLNDLVDLIEHSLSTEGSIKEYLNGLIEDRTKTILGGYFVRHSTSPTTNLVHTWKSQVDCEIISLYEYYVKLLEEQEIAIK